MEKVSLLMKDSSEGDSQKETMIDFILSWTLRRSMQQYSKEKLLSAITKHKRFTFESNR